MIEPFRQGPELIEEILETHPLPGSLAIWWLGQSGFLIKSDGGILVIDPYLSEHLTRKYEGTARPHVRMTRAPLRGADLKTVDLVLASHKHSDHLDPETLTGAAGRLARRASSCCPRACWTTPRRSACRRDRLVGNRRGRGRRSGPGSGCGPSPRPTSGSTAMRAGRHLYLGYVIETEGLRLYHSGDSLAYDGLAEELGPEPFDVLFLPINGRDPARGVPGNMTAAEAVDLAARVRPRYLVPHHYDMFTFNTVPVEAFEAEARRLPPGVEPRILRCGERWEIKT